MRNPRKKQRNYFKISMLLMMLVSLGLIVKINEKRPFFSISQFKHQIGMWFPYENLFNFYDNQVSSSIKYQHLSDNFYVNGTNTCVALFDGVIVQVDDTTIVMYHDNGVKITYSNLSDVMIQVDERVLKGQAIGVFKESVQLDFEKEGKSLDYESVLQQ